MLDFGSWNCVELQLLRASCCAAPKYLPNALCFPVKVRRNNINSALCFAVTVCKKYPEWPSQHFSFGVATLASC